MVLIVAVALYRLPLTQPTNGYAVILKRCLYPRVFLLECVFSALALACVLVGDIEVLDIRGIPNCSLVYSSDLNSWRHTLSLEFHRLLVFRLTQHDYVPRCSVSHPAWWSLSQRMGSLSKAALHRGAHRHRAPSSQALSKRLRVPY